jgi:hypothetical protein
MRKVKSLSMTFISNIVMNMKKLNNFVVKEIYVILETFVIMLKKIINNHSQSHFKSNFV